MYVCVRGGRIRLFVRGCGGTTQCMVWVLVFGRGREGQQKQEQIEKYETQAEATWAEAEDRRGHDRRSMTVQRLHMAQTHTHKGSQCLLLLPEPTRIAT